MVKVIKKHPASKRGGVVKIFTIDYLYITVISLTAMPVRGDLYNKCSNIKYFMNYIIF